MKILLVDDHPVVRRSLRQTIELAETFEVVDEASDGEEAVAKVDELQPHLVLMDMKMPRMDGVEATRLIKARHPEVSVLALTAFGQMPWVAKMLEAGASGYLLKGGSTEDLLRSLDAVGTGGGALDTQVTPTVIEDLTRLYRKEHERALALEDLDRMKTEFMSMISHELRTPVTVISAGVKTIRQRRDKLDEETTESFLETIEQQSMKLAQMIDRILTISMLRGDRLGVDLRTLALDKIVVEVVDSLDDDARRRIDLDLGGISAVGDNAKVRDVLEWIVENALTYTTGTVRVATLMRGGMAAIAVRDEGPGMDGPMLDLLLTQPFLQGNASNTREVGGLGLSIYLASRVLKALGGRLHAVTDREDGSDFSIELPAAGKASDGSDGGGPAPTWSGSVVLWR